MKKILHCVFLFCFSISVSAQDSTSVYKVRHEVGVNATGFINSFLSFNDRTGATGAYFLTYRKYRPDQKTLRLGLNVDFDNSRRQPVDPDDEVTSTLLSFNVRVGWENQSLISKRWVFLHGFDALMGYSNSLVKSMNSFEDVSTNDWTVRLGAGPYGGLQFKINERMGLFTETTMYLIYLRNIEKTKFSVSDDETEKFSAWDLNILLPTTLFFYLKLGK